MQFNARRRQIQPRHEDGDTIADAVADADADGAAIPQFSEHSRSGLPVWADIKPTVNQPKMPFEIHLSHINLSKIPPKLSQTHVAKSQLTSQTGKGIAKEVNNSQTKDTTDNFHN